MVASHFHRGLYWNSGRAHKGRTPGKQAAAIDNFRTRGVFKPVKLGAFYSVQLTWVWVIPNPFLPFTRQADFDGQHGPDQLFPAA